MIKGAGAQLTQFESDFVVEWCVENDHGRYKRLSIVGAPATKTEEAIRHEDRSKPDLYGKPTGKYRTLHTPTHAVVFVAMEVPLPKLEAVTSELRNSTKIRPAASYLTTAAEAADSAAEFRDKMARLELENKRLKELVLDHARTLDDYDKRISKAKNLDGTALRYKIEPAFDKGQWVGTVEGIGSRWAAKAKKDLAATSVRAYEQLSRAHAALDEKRAEVAAKLLSGLPDGDW